MLGISQFFNKINEWTGTKVAWLTLVLMILMCINVLLRYFFNNSVAWRTELEWHLFAFIWLLAAGYTLRHDKHVRVDLFYNQFSPRTQAWVNFLGTLFFLLPWCVVIIWASWQYAMNSWQMNEGSPDNGLPARYILKFAITLGAGLLALQAISLLFSSLHTILSKEDKPVSTH